jgi:hypothetical protein
MKLKLPSSVQIKGPSGETIEVSAAQVVDYVARTARELGASPDVEGVRCGARVIAALASGEIADTDLALLKKALAKPTRGWVAVTVEIETPVPPGEPKRIARRQLVPSAIDVLPIVDALLAL